jgi:energy-converting hydrogenase Eha subunit F
MKRVFALLLAVFLGTGLALAQTGGDKKLNPQPLPPGKKATTATAAQSTKSGKKGHKGGKKGKKSSTSTSTTTPK